MHTADRIRRLGFRRWYERVLLEGHAYLVTCFLGLILTIAGIELFGQRENLIHAAAGLVEGATGALLCLFGLRRYQRLILLAEHLGARATCVRCGHYAAFRLIASGSAQPPDDEDDLEALWMRVKCRDCGNEWIM